MDETALALGFGVEELHQQLRAQRAGAQRVDANVLARVDHRELPGHRDHAALARRVSELRRRGAHESDERGRVDDRAASGATQRGDPVLAAEEYALEVDRERALPSRLVRARRVVVRGIHDARVVEEHVEFAERALGLVDHVRAVGVLGDIGPDELRAAACFLHALHGVVAGRLARVDDDDARAFGGEQERRLAADAAAGTGDQRDFVGEAHEMTPAA
jgi:hypothetical protein